MLNMNGSSAFFRNLDRIVSNFLIENNDLSVLFNEDSNTKEQFVFYVNNHNTIHETATQLIYENLVLFYDIDMTFEKCLETIKNDYNNSLIKQRLRTYQKKLLVATMIRVLINSEDLAIVDFSATDELENNDGKHWYRGQSDFQWRLTPSMFRNLESVFPSGAIIDDTLIEKIYADNGFLRKWKDVFGTETIDYNFLSYMQHSISYSPFLDFTSDFNTALSFSLGNKSSVNDYLYKDSAVFEIEVKNNHLLNEEKSNNPLNFFVEYIPKPYIIGTSILGKPIHSFDDIIQALTPEFVMIDRVTNDRMRYQKGKYILFNNYLSLQGTVFTWLNKDLSVVKYRIRKEEKEKLCDRLYRDYPFLTVEKMMNPYSYFSD